MQVSSPTGERALLWTVYSALLVYPSGTLHRRKGIVRSPRLLFAPELRDDFLAENFNGSASARLPRGLVPRWWCTLAFSDCASEINYNINKNGLQGRSPKSRRFQKKFFSRYS